MIRRRSGCCDDAASRLQLIAELAGDELQRATGDGRRLLERIVRIAHSPAGARAVASELHQEATR